MLEFQVAQEYAEAAASRMLFGAAVERGTGFRYLCEWVGVRGEEDRERFPARYEIQRDRRRFNIGNDENWTGHTLAQANLYGFGRLIWDPELSSEGSRKNGRG